MFKRKNKILMDNKAEAAQVVTPAQDKQLRKETSAYFGMVKAFESDRVALAHKSAKVAWRITGVFAFLAIVSVVAVAGLTPLKTVTPYVIRVDNNTGAADIATPIGDKKTTYGQELDKYWLGTFIVNRESYEWQTVQTMYDTVALMSNNDVFSEYRGIIKNKKTSPLYLLKQEKKVMTRVTSVSFIGDVAQVRFIKFVRNANGTDAPEYPKTAWIATIAYDYKKPIKLESERMINPLGFEVISYRVDPETMGVRG